MAIPPLYFGASKHLAGNDFERLLDISVQFIFPSMCPEMSNTSGEQVIWPSREGALSNGLFIEGI